MHTVCLYLWKKNTVMRIKKRTSEYHIYRRFIYYIPLRIVIYIYGDGNMSNLIWQKNIASKTWLDVTKTHD